ncbi:protoporphyrinogen oxidase [Paenibacillus gansuensis]|uniref:Coproporphyrinogen III oxidase n=1 Tax=Paenibacillus gansuensis TaxID=306542 RepID=A0ABW5PH24_9BACL
MGGQRIRIAVIGGGVTGLSAAFYAQKYAREQGIDAQVTLLEQGGRLGGRINTLTRDGFVIERGPDSFLARKLPMVELARDLGLEGELTPTNPAAKKSYILRAGKLHRMPPGLVLGIPTQFKPFLTTGLISTKGKMRAALDWFLPAKKEPGDESLGHFLERRLGSEVREYMAEPLLAGIYAGDPRNLSLAATFPQFRALEQEHGSLIRGMMASRKKPGAPQRSVPGDTAAPDAQLPAAAKNSVFLTYKGGLNTLIDALAASLAASADVRLNCGVESLRRSSDGYELRLSTGEALQADRVIVTTPAAAQAELLAEVPAARELTRINYVSVANVVLAFERSQIAHPLDGSGFVVPRSEGRTITACTWTSSKWLHSSPSDKVLLRCYVGRSGEEAIVDEDDASILAKVRRDVRDLMGIDAEPLFHEITRLPKSMPQYPVGHPELIRQVREGVAAQLPGVFTAGAAYEGVGLPDCVHMGRTAARDAVAFTAGR